MEVYVIMQAYQDCEGYDHYKIYENKYYLSREEAQAMANQYVEEMDDKYGEFITLYVQELTKA